MDVPFFRPSISEAEIQSVVECLRSGWLTTGPRTKEFESRFAEYVGAKHAIALNSCTAALHLALDAVGLQRGDMVLVPTLTFAATAEVVRYFDAVPVFVDCDPSTLCIDPDALDATLVALQAGRPIAGLKPPYGRVRAIVPVHYGGQMVDVDRIRAIATANALPVIEDAAHTLPAAYRSASDAPWRRVGTTADITCFSFYANKCITTGEGGMAVTNDDAWATRMRTMSLHGMSKDAWKRFMGGGAWFYEIVAPGFKYNLTDVAASLGVQQLTRADALLDARQKIASAFQAGLEGVDELELPRELPNRQHAWHLFAVRLNLELLDVDRRGFIEEMNSRGVAASVHWLPLHMQPYYRDTYGYRPEQFPQAAATWPRLVSLPIFPGMTEAEINHVIASVKAIASEHRRGGRVHSA
jgi:dTDP-4-amino-4,6-dideoxygalactose transaminase